MGLVGKDIIQTYGDATLVNEVPSDASLLVDTKIVQTATYIDPVVTSTGIPSGNYINTYPITCLDAIVDDKDNPTSNLKTIITNLQSELDAKQPMLPNNAADYVMAYTGIAGSFTSVKMSNEVPLTGQSANLTTEKAIGDLMVRLGLLTEAGEVVDITKKVSYSDILDKIELYAESGANEDGTMTQKAITESIDAVNVSLELLKNAATNDITNLTNSLNAHVGSTDNPHEVTAEQTGAVTVTAFEEFVARTDNPHAVTAEQVGLGSANNTADADKPISNATAAKFTEVASLIDSTVDTIANLNYVKTVVMDADSKVITVTSRLGDSVTIDMGVASAFVSSEYNAETKMLELTNMSGSIVKVDMGALDTEYFVADTDTVAMEIAKDASGNTIKASIKSDSVGSDEMKDQSVSTSKLADLAVDDTKLAAGSVTTDKLGSGAVSANKLGSAAVTEAKIADNAVTAGKLADGVVGADKLDANAVVTAKVADLAIVSGKIADSAVTEAKLGSNAVTADKVKDLAIGENKLAALSVTEGKIASDAVVEAKIKDGAVTINKIADAAISTAKLAASAVASAKIAANAVITDKIAANAVTDAKLAEGLVLVGPKLKAAPASSGDDGYNDLQVVSAKWVSDLIDAKVAEALADYDKSSEVDSKISTALTNYSESVIIDPEA